MSRPKAKFNRQRWLIQQLRRLSMKYPPRLEVQNEGKITYYIKSKKGTDVKRVSYSCNLCGKDGLKSTEVQMDHKLPVVDPSEGFVGMDRFLDGLFCERENWQRICIKCHQHKTLLENEQRKK